jgi:hypothetical protein
MSRATIPIVIALSWLAVDQGATAGPPLVESFLHAGRLIDGEKALKVRLGESPGDDQARFGLGVLQFFRAIESLGQSLHRHGLRSERGRLLDIPFLRLPVPQNPNPDPLTYPALRKVLHDLVRDLAKAEATLEAVRDDRVKLPLHLGLVRLNLAGPGQPGQPLRALLERYLGGPRGLPADADLLVVFDRGDVSWLRGYCHLLQALAEIALAHDAQELFDCTAPLFFQNVQTPYAFLNEGGAGIFPISDGVDAIDVIAFIHLLRLPVKQPGRMQAALKHLRRMIALSRESWKYILAETDDDHEWIPNPRQKGALGIPVTQERVDGWLAFLDEAEALLDGKRLIPFWRGNKARGINLRRVFTEPRTLDVVGWVQGTAAAPYLENGSLTKADVWQRLERIFRGEFIGFALWFN